MILLLLQKRYRKADADLGDCLGQAWRSCNSTREGRRGYTCGLWQVLHSLAARAPSDDSGGAAWMHAVRCVRSLSCTSLPLRVATAPNHACNACNALKMEIRSP